MLNDFLVGAAASALTGLALWAVLPRGVVLTREAAGPDAWLIRNDSPVPARIVSVTWSGIDTMRGNKIESLEVPVDPGKDAPIRLTPTDEQFFYEVTLNRQTWRGFVLPPGDELEATVLNNRALRIRYRRAGRTGIFERREIWMHGGV